MPTVAVHENDTQPREARPGAARVTGPSEANGHADVADLTELLTEIRILLPGTEVFLAFLTTLPFTNRFDSLTATQRGVYLCTFFSALTAFICFVAPAAYHRIARPIHDKPRFKVFANVFLVVGLVPVSVSVILATYLVASIVIGTVSAACAAVGMTLMILVAWWVIPILRAHDRYPYRRR